MCCILGFVTLAESCTLQLGQEDLMLRLLSTQVDLPWVHLNNHSWSSSYLEANLCPSRQHSALWQEMSKVIMESQNH